MSKKYCYLFTEGNAKMRELLGGKGANLAEMNLIGIPVPPGFTITTEVCTEYYAHGKDKVIELLRPEVERAVKPIEQLTNMRFGDKTMPLLVSVPMAANASPPLLIIHVTFANVSTLFMFDGLFIYPDCAGNGGLRRGIPR